MKTKTLVSVFWAMIQTISSAPAARLVFAAISILIIATGFTSCSNGPGIRVGYMGATLEIGGRGGQQRRPQQQRMSSGQPYGGGGMYAGAGQQRIYVPGDTMGLGVFGNQPKRPVPGSTITTWDQTPFGTHSPMVMAYNSEGVAKVELVPIRMPVYYYKGDGFFWVWNAKCNNMVKLANSYSQPQPPPQRMAPRPQSYCPPSYAPQRRIMQVPYCPPPHRQAMCLPVQRQWCPPPGYRR